MDDNATREMSDAGLTATTDAVDPLIGRTLEGKYRVESLLGVGGMGRVYKGRNERTDSPVAIKTLSSDLTGDPSLVKRFEVEARSASNLRHPNTIRIYDFGTDQGVLFMVMELLSGRAVEDLIREEGALAPQRAAWIIMEACKSLAEAHAAGLVHRDLKPDNLFLNRVGHSGQEHVKVLDFGVAKLRDKRFSDATLTQAGMIFGTPRYMSPEQARAQDLDGRSDIYALGVMLYELLTGKVPFDANEPIGLLIKHVNEQPPPMRELNPDVHVDPELEAIVYRCLAKNPEERHESVDALLHDLEGIYIRLGGSEALRTLSSDRVPATQQQYANTGGPHTPAGTLGVEAAQANPHTFAMEGAQGTGRPEVHSGTHVAASGSRAPLAILVVLTVAVVIVGLIVGRSLLDRPDTTTPTPAPPTAAASADPTIALQQAGASIGEAHRASRLAAQDATIVLELRAPADINARAWPDGHEELAQPLPHRFPVRRGNEGEELPFVIDADGFQQARTSLPTDRSLVHDVQLEPVAQRPRSDRDTRPGRDSRPDREPPRPGRDTSPQRDQPPRLEAIFDPYE